MGAYWLCLIFCVVAIYFYFLCCRDILFLLFSVSGEVTVV